MPNKRISDLQEKEILISDLTLESFPSSAHLNSQTEHDKKIDFLLARPRERNEKISYSNLKSSILDNAACLTGTQLISGEKTFNSNCSLNSAGPTKDLSISGNCFLENAFIQEQPSAEFFKISSIKDETVAFKTRLKEGFDEFKINLPKTFESNPVICANLESENGGAIKPFIISNVTRHDFSLKLSSKTQGQNYYLNTTALSRTTEEKQVQAFRSTLTKGSNQYEIFFPFAYSQAPIVTISVEGTNKIIPYTISSVNNSSYTITFGTNVNDDYTIHTFSSTQGTKRS